MSTSLGRGAALGVLTVLAERGLSFATLLLAARVLEAERFGLYVYLLAGLMPIQVMADQGLEVAAVNLMARRPRVQATVLATTLLGRLAIWIGLGIPLALLILPALAGCPPTTALAASLGMIVGPSLPYRSLHRARGEMPLVWGIATLDAGATLALAALVLALGGGVAGLFVARAAVGLTVTLWAADHAGIWPRLRTKGGRLLGSLVRAAWPLALNAALLTFMVRTGQLLAMTMLGSTAVGQLGAAARVAEMLSMLAEGVMMAAFPAMAARPRRAARVADEVAGSLGLLVGWAVAVTVAGAGPLIGLLFGAEYTAATSVLAILAWGAMVSAAGSVAFYRLVVGERERLLLRVNAGAAAIGIALQWALIWTAGLPGAALATVLTLASGQGLLCLDRGARRAVLGAWRRMLPPALLAVGAVAAGHAVGGGWGAVAVAGLAYPAGGLVAGVVGEAERREMARLARLLAARIAGESEDG